MTFFPAPVFTMASSEKRKLARALRLPEPSVSAYWKPAGSPDSRGGCTNTHSPALQTAWHPVIHLRDI